MVLNFSDVRVFDVIVCGASLGRTDQGWLYRDGSVGILVYLVIHDKNFLPALKAFYPEDLL